MPLPCGVDLPVPSSVQPVAVSAVGEDPGDRHVLSERCASLSHRDVRGVGRRDPEVVARTRSAVRTARDGSRRARDRRSCCLGRAWFPSPPGPWRPARRPSDGGAVVGQSHDARSSPPVPRSTVAVALAIGSAAPSSLFDRHRHDRAGHLQLPSCEGSGDRGMPAKCWVLFRQDDRLGDDLGARGNRDLNGIHGTGGEIDVRSVTRTQHAAPTVVSARVAAAVAALGAAGSPSVSNGSTPRVGVDRGFPRIWLSTERNQPDGASLKPVTGTVCAVAWPEAEALPAGGLVFRSEPEVDPRRSSTSNRLIS